MLSALLAASLAAPALFRIDAAVQQYGLHGSAVFIADCNTGRYVRRFDVGAASSQQGYDGRNAWIADAGGNSYIQGNADTRAEVLRWGPITCGVARNTEHRSIRIRVGPDTQVVSFPDSRRVRIADQQGVTDVRITGVQQLTAVSDAAFAPPAARDDAAIDTPSGITSIPMLAERIQGHLLPLVVIPVRINGGPPMRFILDSGGQNILTRAAAARLHIEPEGDARVGGAGSGTLPFSYAWVRSVQAGHARMRRQPFMVLPLDMLPGIDGIVGAELLSHFAARFDFASNRLLLASHAPASWFAHGRAAPIAFDQNTPDMAGAIDGIPGRFTIDTGSAGSLDVNEPFARRHDLYRRYHAVANASYAGVGGKVSEALISARAFALGSLTMHGVPAGLSYGALGVSGDPTIAGNVGEKIFRRFTLTLDYPNLRIDFGPPERPLMERSPRATRARPIPTRPRSRRTDRPAQTTPPLHAW